MERLSTMELKVIAVTEPLGAGQGAITAKHQEATEKATERIEQAATYCEQIPLGRPSGCIDGRGVLEALDGSQSELGPKTAGGSAISGLFSYAMEGHIAIPKDAYIGLARVVTQLEEHEEAPARFHIDADHRDAVFSTIEAGREKYQDISNIEAFIDAVMNDEDIPAGTGCGMGDQFTGAVSCMANSPRTFKKEGQELTETEADIAARLEFMRANTAAISGDGFTNETFDAHVANATTAVESGVLKEFNEMKALIIADRALSDAGVANGAMSRIEVLATSDEGVHGHVEDGILVVEPEGIVFNLTKYQTETGGSYFSYEKWVRKFISKAISTGISDYEKAIERNIQGVDTANVAAAFQLADGTQRVGIVE